MLEDRLEERQSGEETATPDFSDMSIALACMVASGNGLQGRGAGSGCSGSLRRTAASLTRCGEDFDDERANEAFC